MALKKLWETEQAGGSAQYLITGAGTIYLKATAAPTQPEGSTVNEGNGGVTATVNHLTGESSTGTQTVSIMKIHWTGGFTLSAELEGDDTATSIVFDGNGTWSQFNGWTPVTVSSNIEITGAGSVFMEVKKVSGYDRFNSL